MAAVASDTISLTINGIEVEVPNGELIVESVKRLGLEIPIFCYHPRMKPVGMCRMCLVEVGFKQPDGSVRTMPKPQAACTLPASPNMVVYTDSEMVHRDRKGVLEFLLINHPLDCPICDRGGECPLQNNTLFYGPSTSRFVEAKRHAKKAFALSKYVTLDLERCIQCGRCVRFTEEISGDAELAFRFRGAQMQPSTFELRDFTSKFSGNVIEICPVGALTNAEYRFRARPWDLQTKPSICTVCSNGCNIWFDYRVNKMMRINGRTNEAINEEWTCDKGKYGHEAYNATNRLTKPLIRNGDRLEETDWPTAYATIMEHFKIGENKVAALADDKLSNEGYYLLQRLMREEFKSNNLDHRWTTHLQTRQNRLENLMGQKQVQTRIADFEKKKTVLVFGTSLADDEPILFLRLRKAWLNNGTKVIVAHHAGNEVEEFANTVLRYRPGQEAWMANALLAAAVEAGISKVPDATKAALPSVKDAAAGLEISEGVLREVVKSFGEGGVVVTTHGLFNCDEGQDALETLGGLAMTLNMEFNCYALGLNDQGATEMGFLPDCIQGGAAVAGKEGYNTHGILKECKDGSIGALWVVGNVPVTAEVTDALESIPFLVVQSTHHTEAVNYASVVLPMEMPNEHTATYTNMEGQVQEIQKILQSPGEAKSDWQIFSEIMIRLKSGKPYFNAAEVRAELALT